jgi:uncharacterized membrane protein
MFLQKIKNIVGANLLIISLLLIFSGFLIMSINTTENNGGEKHLSIVFDYCP